MDPHGFKIDPKGFLEFTLGSQIDPKGFLETTLHPFPEKNRFGQLQSGLRSSKMEPKLRQNLEKNVKKRTPKT
jgi:hypothetical protein